MPNIITRNRGPLVAALAAGLALLPTATAAADPPVPTTPYLDCVHFNGDHYTAYFGYSNTGPVQFSFPVGDFNNVFPGSIDAGQPTAYDPGNYPRVFSVDFDGHFIPTVNWELNNTTVVARTTSPACTSGITVPASDLTNTSATLNGVVTPEGEDTTYRFEYGTSASFGTSTATQDAGSSAQPQLVQAALTGLAPSTQYFFRLDTTNAMTGTTDGKTETFTTPAPASTTPAPGHRHHHELWHRRRDYRAVQHR